MYRQHYKPVVIKTETKLVEKIADYSLAIGIGLALAMILVWQLSK